MTRFRWPATLEDGRKVLVTTGYERTPGRYFLSVQDRDSGRTVFSSSDLLDPLVDPVVVIELLDRQKLPRPPRLIQLLTESSQRHSDVRTYQPFELVLFGAAAEGPDLAGAVAQAGYEAFYIGSSGVPWAQLPAPLREAWTRAAEAIAAAIRRSEPVIGGASSSAPLERPQAEGANT